MIKHILFLSLAMAVLFIGCYPESNLESKDIPVSGESSNFRTSQPPDTIMGIPLPVGTQTSIVGNDFTFQLPSGYGFGGIDNQGNVHLFSSGSGEPIQFHPQIITDSNISNLSNTHTLTVSSAKMDKNTRVALREYYIFTPTSFTPGFTEEILFVNDLHLWEQLSWACEEVIKSNEQLLSEIIDFAFEDYSEGDLTVRVAVAINSSRFLLEVPYSSLENNMMYTSSLAKPDGETAPEFSIHIGDVQPNAQNMLRISTCNGKN